jgi:hypothetical protein
LSFLDGREEAWEQWPDIGFEITDVSWQGAEPDVGIFSSYVDDHGATYWIGDRKFVNDHPGFIAELHRVIGADIVESEADLSSMIEAVQKRMVDDMEPDDGSYFDDRDDYGRYDD